MSLADRLNNIQTGSSTPPPSPTGSSTVGERDIKHQVHEHLLAVLGQHLYGTEIDAAALQQHVFDAIQTVLARTETPLSSVDRARIVQEVSDDILGHGPLEPLLRDSSITEILVNRYDEVFIERGGLLQRSRVTFRDDDHLRRTIERIVSRVGRRIDEASPMVDARLADGSRVNAVISPISLNGSALTIRKFSDDPFTVRDLVAMGTLTPGAASFIEAAVVGRRNIVISGGTGSGKTTTLNVLSSFIPDNERIITIEDAAELRLVQPHVVRLESRPPNVEGQGEITIRDLVRNSLRMRPDRIVVGEVRDAAALDMLQAMNTGHDGSLTTVHANSPRDALSRIETMSLMAGMELPIQALREQMSSAIHLMIQQDRLKDGSRRITRITELTGLEGDIITAHDIFTFQFRPDLPGGQLGQLVATGIRPRMADDLADRGIDLPYELFTP